MLRSLVGSEMCIRDRYDTGQGMTKEQSLCEVLVGYSWGKLEAKELGATPTWKLAHYAFSMLQPAEGLTTYKDFISAQHPLKTKAEEPVLELRNQYNRKIRNQMRQFYFVFFNPGNPGAKLKHEHEKVRKALNLPKVVLDDMGINVRGDGQNTEEMVPGSSKDSLADLFFDGKYFIFPSFFRTMLMLKKAKRDFGIIFRTFGADSMNVVTEYNRFCEGTHPCYNGKNNFPLARFDGSKGSKNFILDQTHVGVVHRSPNMSEIALVMGTVKKQNPNQFQTLEDAYAKELEEKRVTIIKGSDQVYVSMLEMLKEASSLGWVDDYLFWKRNDEKQLASKFMLIDQSDYNIDVSPIREI
eukprot:TRINITY_DN8258_c0_g1_i2.p1 TRINITY_DN8258_c0_g1~~TRINITY_DN8258_c0_g1_i2.p1  ORF type:complete len:355 (+),score=82.88 TRINITY_DN8258_c0_g1_i2:274-1338(+)